MAKYGKWLIALVAFALVVFLMAAGGTAGASGGWTDGPATPARDYLGNPYQGREGVYGWATQTYNYNWRIPAEIAYARHAVGETDCVACQEAGNAAYAAYQDGDYNEAYQRLGDLNMAYRTTDWQPRAGVYSYDY